MSPFLGPDGDLETRIHPAVPRYPKPVRTCVGCGCTDDRACPGGCSWSRKANGVPYGVCSTCAPELAGPWDRRSSPLVANFETHGPFLPRRRP